jgi:hypothetical protein
MRLGPWGRGLESRYCENEKNRRRSAMSKSQDVKKDKKKQPEKTLKEKRLEKKEKKSGK